MRAQESLLVVSAADQASTGVMLEGRSLIQSKRFFEV